MGGIEGNLGARAADWDEIQRRQAASCGSAPTTRTEPSRTLPSHDATAIPEAVRNYDPSMFANPALGGAALVAAKPVTRIAGGPDPLPPAADAFHGIQLLCLADDLPSMTRTDAKNAFTVGSYRMQPAVRVHEDGSVSVLYWVAVNKEAKRGELVVGPGELETFKAHATEYERAVATAYMNGEPNEWQRQSLKTVDDAMRKGVMYGLQSLNRAWLAAVQDPGFWGQTALNVVTSLAGAGPAARAEAEIAEDAPKKLPQGPGPHTPTVEGGLSAHEGGPPNGHTLSEHVGKTEAELRARFTEVRIGKNGKPVKPPSSNSAFYNRATAEANIVKTMATNEQAIKDWVADPNAKPRLKLEYHPDGPAFPVGRKVLAKGGDAIDVAGTRTVLIKDPTTAAGFRILTAFPIE